MNPDTILVRAPDFIEAAPDLGIRLSILVAFTFLLGVLALIAYIKMREADEEAGID